MFIQGVSCNSYKNLYISEGIKKQNKHAVSTQINSDVIPLNKLDRKYFSLSFGSTRSNYLVLNKSKGGLVPVIIVPGVDLRHYDDGSAAYPQFKISNADFSNGKLAHCYMKGSEIIESKLIGANMFKIRLHESNLTGSNFTRCYAPDAIFKDSDFSHTNLSNFDARRSNFQNAKFDNANLERADFTNANLMGADLSNAINIDSATFNMAIYDKDTKFPIGFNPQEKFLMKFEKGADLRGIILHQAYIKSHDITNPDDYSNTDFSSYDGERASFKRSKFANLFLTNCNFSDIDGTGMSLAGSVLYGSKFNNADLTSADLHGIQTDPTTRFSEDTILRNANLIDAELAYTGIENLPPENLEGAIYSNSTTFPAGFDPQKVGMRIMGPGSDFTGYDFSGMSFRDTSPSKNHIISLADSKFVRTDFSQTDLCNMDLSRANFRESYFRDAEMENTNCEGANFLNAKLYGANLCGANLRNTNLTWAKMQGIKIDEKTDFTGAKYNDDTVFPFDFPENKKSTMKYIPRVMAPGY